MSTTMLHIKLDQTDKAAIQASAEALGMSASAFVLNAARQIIREGELRLQVSPIPTPELQAVLDLNDENDDAVFTADTPEHDAFLASLAA